MTTETQTPREHALVTLNGISLDRLIFIQWLYLNGKLTDQLRPGEEN